MLLPLQGAFRSINCYLLILKEFYLILIKLLVNSVDFACFYKAYTNIIKEINKIFYIYWLNNKLMYICTVDNI